MNIYITLEIIGLIISFIFFFIFLFKISSIQYKKVIIIISTILFLSLLLVILFNHNNNNLILFLFYLIVVIIYILSLFYILIFLDNRLKQIITAYKNLTEWKTNTSLRVNAKDDLGILEKSYLQLNMIISSLLANVENFSKELFEKMNKLYNESAKVKKGINEQQEISNNLDLALNIQGESLDKGAKGLDDTRVMFNKTVEIFTSLFNLINSLFDQNQIILKENKNMENYSKNAIRMTENLENVTKDGTDKIDKIINFINTLAKSIDSIKNAVTIIKKMASQTNILAMNASIEAAHAGEYGKGFSVVANEIRELAESSAKASETISKVVDNIINDMNKGKEYSSIARGGIEEINEAIHNTIEVIKALYESVEKQVKSVVDTKDSLEEIHNLSKKIKDSSEYQQRKTQDIYEATENLNSQAIIINSLISNQKLQLDELLQMIDNLYKVIDESNVYANYLTQIINKFKNTI